jgi:hypothetical protein
MGPPHERSARIVAKLLGALSKAAICTGPGLITRRRRRRARRLPQPLCLPRRVDPVLTPPGFLIPCVMQRAMVQPGMGVAGLQAQATGFEFEVMGLRRLPPADEARLGDPAEMRLVPHPARP